MNETTSFDTKPSDTDTDATSVCCRGGSGALGHPAVYLYFGENVQEVTCYYCGRVFKRNK